MRGVFLVEVKGYRFNILAYYVRQGGVKGARDVYVVQESEGFFIGDQVDVEFRVVYVLI